MKEHKGIYALLIALCIGVIGLSVGYAALSTQLRIVTGNVTSNALAWKVAFTNGTVSGVKSATSDTGITCGTASVTDESVTVVASTLSKPGDTCTYHLTINNTGSLDAKLSSIVPTAPTGETCTVNGAEVVCGNITYALTTDAAGNTLLTNNQVLAASTGKLDVYLVTKYTGADVVAAETTTGAATFTLTYSQE